MTNMNKKDIIKALELIATYLEIKGENPFKISAYRKAAQALENDARSLNEIEEPSKIKGIGKGTGQVIDDLITAGESSILIELQNEIPASLLHLLKIPGLGGKKIGKLYQALNVTNLESLQTACENGSVKGLEGFGAKTEEKLLKAIESFKVRPDRLPLSYMLPLAEKIEAILGGINEIITYSRAGSLRRSEPLIKDLDFVISTEHPDQVSMLMKERLSIKEVTNDGKTKVSVVLNDDHEVSVDFRFVEPEQYTTTLHHFTGSKDHNVLMRQLAKKQNEKISEYGVENQETGEIITFSTEKDFYAHFALPEFPPELRGGQKEWESFLESPDSTLQLSDIQADLHMHTTWSDGANSLSEMAEAARQKGYRYIVITDHSQFLKVAHGLTPDRLKRQREEIDKLNENYSDFKIFAGVEMDILPNGTLDYNDDVLDALDFVIGAIHSSFSQSEEKIMERLTMAAEHPAVRLIAHPTGRIIGGRSGYPVNVDALIDIASSTDTALELNANPHRLDLSPKWLEKAQNKGVKLAINTDAHSIQMLNHMAIGVATARKGFIKKPTLLNTMDLTDFEAFLKKK